MAEKPTKSSDGRVSNDLTTQEPAITDEGPPSITSAGVTLLTGDDPSHESKTLMPHPEFSISLNSMPKTSSPENPSMPPEPLWPSPPATSSTPSVPTRTWLMGFPNQGNRSYVGAIVRNLLACESFRRALLKICKDGCFLSTEFKKLMLDNSKIDSFLKKLVEGLPQINEQNQKDAEEFLIRLVHGLKNEEECAELVALFEGEVANLYECRSCLKKDPFQREQFYDISLSSPPTYTAGVDDQSIFEDLQPLDVFDQMNLQQYLDMIMESCIPESWNCMNCSSSSAYRKILVSRPPTILCILNKNQTDEVRLGCESLDLGRHMMKGDNSGEKIEVNYQLSGVVSCFLRKKEGEGGEEAHYVAYIRHGGQWYYADDGNVHPCTDSQVLSVTPFLVFYEKM